MIDIEDFLWRQFGDVKTYGNPQTDWRVDCPFCFHRVGSTDYKGHLHISINKHTCHCFRCDYSASWVGLVMDTTGFDYHRALGELYVVPNPKDFDDLPELISNNAQEQKIVESQPIELPDDYVPLWKGSFGLTSAVRAYARRRGFQEDAWRKYNFGYVPSVGARLYIPVEGNYWQARAIFPFQEPKYIGPKEESSHILSNSRALHIYDEIVVTEGILSGIAVGDNHVSLVGKNATPEKVRRLVSAPVEHYIITVEPEAKKEMMRLADELRAADKHVTLWIYESGDPADSQPSEVNEYNFGTKVRLMLKIDEALAKSDDKNLKI